MCAQETQKTEENERGVDLNINIYYGGRGIIDDPTIYVINKMQEVLEELRVHVERYNLYDGKTNITTLPQTLKEADGIILATTVEWYGIGGYMQQFLDACWLYGDKEKIKTTYMQPIVMSTTYGEREGELTLQSAWEILGGQPCPGLCGYVEDLVSFEMNKDYTVLIEKKAENLYRTISQKVKCLPTSNQAVKQTILRTPQLELTPQESEQLSKYVSDDTYVKKQKEDIEELATMFKGMLGKSEKEDEEAYIENWILDFGYDMNVIEIALKRTTYKQNPTFEYINSIITDWHERNLKTPDQVEAFLEQRKKQTKDIKEMKSKVSKANYEQRQYDNLDFLYANNDNV